MTVEEVYDLIAPSKNNLIKIAKAVITDFEAVLGYYMMFERLPLKKALMKVSNNIVDAYKDKEDLWIEVQQELETL